MIKTANQNSVYVSSLKLRKLSKWRIFEMNQSIILFLNCFTNGIFYRNTWQNTPETNPTSVRSAPNNSITRRICEGTCACTQAKNLSPVRCAAKASSGKTEWSSTPILTRKNSPYSWHDNRIIHNRPIPLGEAQLIQERLCNWTIGTLSIVISTMAKKLLLLKIFCSRCRARTKILLMKIRAINKWL